MGKNKSNYRNRKNRMKNISSSFCRAYFSLGAHNKNTWMGCPIIQTPSDIIALQECVVQTRPTLIIETGTKFGGSSLFFSSLMYLLNIEGKIITFDLKNVIRPEARNNSLWKKYVTFFNTSSTLPEKVSYVKEESKKHKSILVFLDSGHRKRNVDKEIEQYYPLVTIGNYLIVADTCVNGNPILPKYGPGPMESVISFLKTHNNFIIDKTKESNFMTFFPNGFLKRVK